MKITLVITIIKSSMYSCWFLCIKLKYSEHSFAYTLLQCEIYRDPAKGNVIEDTELFVFWKICQKNTKIIWCKLGIFSIKIRKGQKSVFLGLVNIHVTKKFKNIGFGIPNPPYVLTLYCLDS